MNSPNFNEIEDALNNYGTSIKQIELLYPKLYEPVIPLSRTGVSSRTYFYWKTSGLINVINTEEEDKERGWVKISLIDFVWIKLVEIFRDFGVPFDTIKETKNLLYTNYIEDIIEEKDDYLDFLRSETSLSKAKINQIDNAIESAKKLVDEDLNNLSEEYKPFHSILGSMIMDLFIKNDKGYIVITKQSGDFDINYFTLKTAEDFMKFVQPIFEKPSLHVPIRSMVAEFLEEFDNDKYIETLNLLSLKEKKVIDAIRKKDFKEIIIKQDNKKESIIIELEKDGDLINNKALEVKRILGLNEYSEVTIKFRNDKHLYFKKKTRL